MILDPLKMSDKAQSVLTSIHLCEVNSIMQWLDEVSLQMTSLMNYQRRFYDLFKFTLPFIAIGKRECVPQSKGSSLTGD